MKRIIKVLSIVLFFLILISPGISPVQAATKEFLKNKLQSATSEPIREFFYMDLNGDGKKEAVGVTAEVIDEFGYVWAKMWYISSSKCYLFHTFDMCLYKDSIRFYKLKGTKMLCCSGGAGGSGYYAFGWTFDKNGARTVENTVYGLNQIKGNEFLVYDSQYDGSVDGSGHTWNIYFSKWDGKKLVEYGGLEITEDQLKKAKNRSRIFY